MPVKDLSNKMNAALDDTSLQEMRNSITDAALMEMIFNSLKGKKDFNCVVLSGADRAYQHRSPKSMHASYYPIRVRPINILDSILPDPCANEFKDPRKASIVGRILQAHPIAFADRPIGNDERMPRFGDILRCRFVLEGPNNEGKLRGIRYFYPLEGHDSIYDCDNEFILEDGRLSVFDTPSTSLTPGRPQSDDPPAPTTPPEDSPPPKPPPSIDQKSVKEAQRAVKAMTWSATAKTYDAVCLTHNPQNLIYVRIEGIHDSLTSPCESSLTPDQKLSAVRQHPLAGPRRYSGARTKSIRNSAGVFTSIPTHRPPRFGEKIKVQVSSDMKGIMYQHPEMGKKYVNSICKVSDLYSNIPVPRATRFGKGITPTPLEGYGIHYPWHGETLNKIRRKYGASVDEMRQLNKHMRSVYEMNVFWIKADGTPYGTQLVVPLR